MKRADRKFNASYIHAYSQSLRRRIEEVPSHDWLHNNGEEKFNAGGRNVFRQRIRKNHNGSCETK